MKFFTYLFSLWLICFYQTCYADETSQASVWNYIIKKNDSFERLFQNYLAKHENVEALANFNHHRLSKKLQPGQVISIPVEMLKHIPARVQVVLVYGDVNAFDATSKISHKVNNGDFLGQGDSLTVNKNSLAKLHFADGTAVDVQSNSTLTIVSSYQLAGIENYVTDLKLTKGRTEVVANPGHTIGNKLQVQTPSAIAAVRGTQFRVGAEESFSLQETLDGQVAFTASGQEVLLPKGYGTIAEKDKEPLPPQLLPNAPDVSNLPNLLDSKPYEVDVPTQSDAVAWFAQLSLDENFTQIINEQITQSGKMVFADLADGQYFLKLRAQDQHGLQSVDAKHAFKVKFEALVELLAPQANDHLTAKSIKLSWLPIPSSTGYRVQISKDINFNDKVFERYASFDSLMVLQPFEAGDYYWRVSAMIDGKPQKTSKIRKFILSN